MCDAGRVTLKTAKATEYKRTDTFGDNASEDYIKTGIQSYRDLVVWQKSMDLVEEVYKLIKLLPKEENYALADQMRRGAVSVPSNIAEGQARSGSKEFLNFLSIAQGSKSEIQTQILICERLNYLTREQTKTALLLTEEVGRLNASLMKKLSEKSKKLIDL